MLSGIFGNNIKFSIFGESHGKAIGITIDGLPVGISINFDYIRSEMKRRAPGRNKFSTPRKEKDDFEIISGIFNGKTTGTPLCAIIKNTNNNSKDYESIKNKMRPGHADFTGIIKYKGFNDYRGGGHFSGRLTAPIVFAGAIAKQILREKEIYIGSHISSIGKVKDIGFNPCGVLKEELLKFTQCEFPVIDNEKSEEMKREILKAKEEKNSVGGTIESMVINLPKGLGDPFFDSVESVLSHMIFSIPAVKGIEFGAGFDISQMKGSDANDEFYIENNKVKLKSNNNGGILGGITNGMPLVFKVAIKPTPSIGLTQQTIDLSNMSNTTINIKGRHDPCIVQRAIPVIEAATAMVLIDLMKEI